MPSFWESVWLWASSTTLVCSFSQLYGNFYVAHPLVQREHDCMHVWFNKTCWILLPLPSSTAANAPGPAGRMEERQCRWREPRGSSETDVKRQTFLFLQVNSAMKCHKYITEVGILSICSCVCQGTCICCCFFFACELMKSSNTLPFFAWLIWSYFSLPLFGQPIWWYILSISYLIHIFIKWCLFQIDVYIYIHISTNKYTQQYEKSTNQNQPPTPSTTLPYPSNFSEVASTLWSWTSLRRRWRMMD